MIHLNKENDKYVVAKYTTAVKKLTILVADKTKNLLKEVINEGKANLILDLENIAYIDSSGFGAIISVYNYAKSCNVKLILCNVSDTNMALIKITKLDNLLIVYSNLDEAIKAIK